MIMNSRNPLDSETKEMINKLIDAVKKQEKVDSNDYDYLTDLFKDIFIDYDLKNQTKKDPELKYSMRMEGGRVDVYDRSKSDYTKVDITYKPDGYDDLDKNEQGFYPQISVTYDNTKNGKKIPRLLIWDNPYDLLYSHMIDLNFKDKGNLK